MDKYIAFFLFFMMFGFSVKAQSGKAIYFTTSAGIFSPVSTFSDSYKNSLALNSGIEYQFSKHYYAQFVLDFNAVKYNQQIRDANSPYLFKETNSSVFLSGLNLGRNIFINKNKKLFFSPYVSFGYANIGEPRLALESMNVFKQVVVRNSGIYTKQGIRLGFQTSSKILQTLYVDAAYFSSNIRVQNAKPKAFSFLAGTRVGF